MKNKKYTLTKAAIQQRRKAAWTTAARKKWVTTKIDRTLDEYAKKHFGTVNTALMVLRDMNSKKK